jgi:dipeptidyl-peptidase-4
VAIDDFPRQLGSTRRFTLGVPRAVTVSRDGGRVLSCVPGAAKTRSRASGGWTWPMLKGTAGECPSGFSPIRRLRGTPVTGDVPETELVRRQRARELAAGIVAYSADDACRTVVFALDGRLWVLRVGEDPREPAGVPEPVPAAGGVTDPRIDPTGQRVAYVADGALHVTERADGTGRLLAAPEHEDVAYGLAEHVAAESMDRFSGYWWAPDGRRLLAARADNSPVQRWWIADPANPERPPRRAVPPRPRSHPAT